MTVYIAGPMRGKKNFNFPLFDEVRDFLESRQISVVSPADLDRKAGNVIERNVGTPDYSVELSEWFNYDEVLAADLEHVKAASAVVLLPDAAMSKGARKEALLAEELGKVLFVHDPLDQRLIELEPGRFTALCAALPLPEEQVADMQPATWDEAAKVVALGLLALYELTQRVGPVTAAGTHAKMLRHTLDQVLPHWPLGDDNLVPVHGHDLALVDVLSEMTTTAVEYLVTEGYDAEAWLLGVAALAADKQANYGPQNILTFGMNGIVVRVSDKVARIENMMAKGRDGADINEPLTDAWKDIIGYTIVAAMLEHGWFELPLKRDLEPNLPRIPAGDPDGREKSLALTNLEQTSMWSKAAVARNQGEVSS